MTALRPLQSHSRTPMHSPLQQGPLCRSFAAQRNAAASIRSSAGCTNAPRCVETTSNHALRTALSLTRSPCRVRCACAVRVAPCSPHSASPSFAQSAAAAPVAVRTHLPPLLPPPAMDRIYCSEQIEVPPPLPAILKAYTKEVIRYNPRDIPAFSRESAQHADDIIAEWGACGRVLQDNVPATTSTKSHRSVSSPSVPACSVCSAPPFCCWSFRDRAATSPPSPRAMWRRSWRSSRRRRSRQMQRQQQDNNSNNTHRNPISARPPIPSIASPLRSSPPPQHARSRHTSSNFVRANTFCT